ncbi:hypothetical protein PVAP13_9NG541528 [Panicum virgatum]|uniref:H15 domain-containing protein n=1 Tax=Panicum virgatum TaxID=38727 RepID=A0A8T0MXC6_PANVG|nr:hypothetical protein PVAP13_9NG541528 [Panicum virgatum]
MEVRLVDRAHVPEAHCQGGKIEAASRPQAAAVADPPARAGGDGRRLSGDGPRRRGLLAHHRRRGPAGGRADRPPVGPPPGTARGAQALVRRRAIAALNERTGSSSVAIGKYVEKKHGAKLPPNFRKLLAGQLKKFAAAGKLTRVKNSFKLAAAGLELAVGDFFSFFFLIF